MIQSVLYISYTIKMRVSFVFSEGFIQLLLKKIEYIIFNSKIYYLNSF